MHSGCNWRKKIWYGLGCRLALCSVTSSWSSRRQNSACRKKCRKIIPAPKSNDKNMGYYYSLPLRCRTKISFMDAPDINISRFDSNISKIEKTGWEEGNSKWLIRLWRRRNLGWDYWQYWHWNKWQRALKPHIHNIWDSVWAGKWIIIIKKAEGTKLNIPGDSFQHYFDTQKAQIKRKSDKYFFQFSDMWNRTCS